MIRKILFDVDGVLIRIPNRYSRVLQERGYPNAPKARRALGVECFLATDQNHYRKNFLLNGLGFKDIFDGWFLSADIGYRKINKEYWDCAILKLKNECPDLEYCEMLFIDDRIENILIAEKIGLKTFHAPDASAISLLYESLNDEIEIRRNLAIAST